MHQKRIDEDWKKPQHVISLEMANKIVKMWEHLPKGFMNRVVDIFHANPDNVKVLLRKKPEELTRIRARNIEITIYLLELADDNLSRKRILENVLHDK